jgi:hypothetical protein
MGIGTRRQVVPAAVAVEPEGHAHAGADVQLQAAHVEGLRRGVDDLGRHAVRVAAALHTGQRHGKLVTADARHGVGGPHQAAQALAELAQHLVAHGVAVLVVSRS